MGRPRKGEKAVSIARIEKEKRQSSIKRLQWLRKIINNNGKLQSDFNAFTMQAFCEYESETLGFVAQSVNTFKKHLGSTKNINEVKDMLTELRRRGGQPKSSEKKSKSETILSKKKDIIELKQEIQVLTDDLLGLRCAYKDLLRVFENMPIKDKAIAKAIQEQRDKYGLRLINGDNNVNKI